MGTPHLVRHLGAKVDDSHNLVMTESIIVHNDNIHGDFCGFQFKDVKLERFVEDWHQSVLLYW